MTGSTRGEQGFLNDYGHWKTTGQILVKILTKNVTKNLEIKGGVHDLEIPRDHAPTL